jgi:hypothetical protein
MHGVPIDIDLRVTCQPNYGSFALAPERFDIAIVHLVPRDEHCVVVIGEMLGRLRAAEELVPVVEQEWKLITRPTIPFLFSQPVPTGPNKFDRKDGIGDI